ncbi:MAG: lamin tail domain-containing protein [Fibrobacter sp.]|nr:lamin tail domain-containing protein [Fibrobacter sp.]
MKNRSQKYLLISAVISILIFIFCGKIPTKSEGNSGSLEIRCLVLQSQLAKTARTEVTAYDSLIVEISASDMPTLRTSHKIAMGEPLCEATVPAVPSGTGRAVKIYTINKMGLVIHTDSISSRVMKIEPTVVTSISAVLVPAAGSIYIQIGNVPSGVDSIFASFVSVDSTWATHANRTSPKVSFSIDRIPHKTKGTLSIAGVSSSGDTLYFTSQEMVFSAIVSSSIPIYFQTLPGEISMQISMRDPGITVVSGSMGNASPADTESGELLITEIMYNANNSEYIEVYNPQSSAVLFDTLIIDIDGAYRIITDLQIGAKGYHLFGRMAFPWLGDAADSTGIDLASLGNWITLRKKDMKVIDQVIFTGGSNTLQWPNVAGDKSIILLQPAYDVKSNNFGRNWITASTVIEGNSALYGTPGEE